MVIVDSSITVRAQVAAWAGSMVHGMPISISGITRLPLEWDVYVPTHEAGVLNGLQREDGSGRCYNLYLNQGPGDPDNHIFVRFDKSVPMIDGICTECGTSK